MVWCGSVVLLNVSSVSVWIWGENIINIDSY